LSGGARLFRDNPVMPMPGTPNRNAVGLQQSLLTVIFLIISFFLHTSCVSPTAGERPSTGWAYTSNNALAATASDEKTDLELQFAGSIRSKGLKPEKINEAAPINRLKAAGSLVLESRVKQAEAGENPQAKPKTWTMFLSPAPSSRFFAGAVDLSGFALRAGNPVASEPRVFHMPDVPSNEALLAPGESRKCGKAAVEFQEGGLRTAILVDAVAKAPAIAAASFTKAEPKNRAWEIDAFMAGGMVRQDTEETWFLEAPQLPATSIAMGGLGSKVHLKGLSFNIQGLLSSTGLGNLWGGTNGEGRIAGKSVSLSAGFSSFARDYLGIYGKKPRAYSRAYMAPTLNMETLIPAFSLFRIGALVSRSVQRRERPWEDDPVIDTQAFAMEGQKGSLWFSLHFETEGDNDRYSVSLKKEFYRILPSEFSLKLSMEGNSSWKDKAVYGFTSRILAHPHPRVSIESGFSGIAAAPIGRLRPAVHARVAMKWTEESALEMRAEREELASGCRIAFSAGLYRSLP